MSVSQTDGHNSYGVSSGSMMMMGRSLGHSMSSSSSAMAMSLENYTASSMTR
jgi:hypothetical protein